MRVLCFVFTLGSFSWVGVGEGLWHPVYQYVKDAAHCQLAGMGIYFFLPFILWRANARGGKVLAQSSLEGSCFTGKPFF